MPKCRQLLSFSLMSVWLLSACPQENLETRPSDQATPSASDKPQGSPITTTRPSARPTPKLATFASGRPADLVVNNNYRPDILYSSVIIDARGLGISASMSPTIQVGQQEIFPLAGEIDQDYVVNVGLAAYVYGGIETARQSTRAGKTPLILRAKAAHGRFGSGVELADKDGRDLIKASARSGILKQYKLIILLDKSKPE